MQVMITPVSRWNSLKEQNSAQWIDFLKHTAIEPGARRGIERGVAPSERDNV